MYQFTPITEKQAEALEISWNLFQHLKDSDELPTYYIVGILDSKHNKEVADIYAEHLKDYAEDDEEIASPDVKSVAVSIQVSSDQLYYLLSGGLLLDNEECALQVGTEVVTLDLHLRSLGRIKFGSLGRVSLATESEAVSEFLTAGNTKTSSPNSRIVRVLDEAGNSWNEDDKQSNLEMLERIEDSNKSNQFVSFAEGNLSKFFIEVKNGPEAAIRYIASKLDMDYDEVAAASAVLTWQEAKDFINEILSGQ